MTPISDTPAPGQGTPQIRSRQRGLAAALASLLVLGFGASGCAKGTYLQVNVTGTGIPEIQSLDVTLTLIPAGDGGQLRVSEGPIGNDASPPIKLPTSFAFKLDSESGFLEVSAVARDASGKPIASASTSTTIMHGQTWTVVLNLTPLLAASSPATSAPLL